MVVEGGKKREKKCKIFHVDKQNLFACWLISPHKMSVLCGDDGACVWLRSFQFRVVSLPLRKGIYPPILELISALKLIMGTAASRKS